MPAPGEEVKDQESFKAFIAKTKAGMEAAEATGERVKELTLATEQMRIALDNLRAANAAGKEYVPDGSDTDVERRYVARNADQADIPGGAAAVADSRTHRKTVREGIPFMGSESGVIRLLSGRDESGFFEKGLLDDPTPASEWQHELQRRLEMAAWQKAFSPEGRVPAATWRAIQRHIARGPRSVAKIFADNAGEGGEWITTIPLAQLERTAELQRMLEPLIPSMNLTGPANTYPFLSTGLQAFRHGGRVAGDMNPANLQKSVPSTAERTITAETLSVVLPADLDAVEDSIIDFVQVGNDLLARALVDAFEDMLINGDTAATHGDTGFLSWNPRNRWQVLGSSADHRKTGIGFRQRCYDVDGSVATAVTSYQATQTVAAYMAARAGLTGPHGFGDLLYITSPEHYLVKLITDSNLLTVDKYGPSATIQNGEVGKIGGHRLVISDFMTSDLETSGLYTGGGGVRTGMLIVNLARFRVARRRSMAVAIETQRTTHSLNIVATERKTIHSLDGNTVANARYLIDLDSA